MSKVKEKVNEIKPIKKISKLSFRNKIAFSISTLSFFFLFPGIYLSMLTVKSKGSVSAKVPQVEYNFFGFPSIDGTEMKHMSLNIFDTSRSILKTVNDLWDKQYQFVACMILLFSVLLPIFKGIALTYVFFTKNFERRGKIFDFIKSIGKWSMCDVFIVAILLSYLSTGALESHNATHVVIMGQNIPVNMLVGMHAQLELGFWCFLTYCLLSLLALQLYESY